MKLELILRLLDNDELSTDQVNDLKEFLEDYVERNQVCTGKYTSQVVKSCFVIVICMFFQACVSC